MIKILYQNTELVFAVKPRGIASQESPKSENMINLLRKKCGCDIFCVHRLDTATGGVMVYAKNQKAAAHLSKAFAEKTADKEYLAVAAGDVPSKGTLTDYLWHDRQKNKAFVVKTKRAGAKEARLGYEKIRSDGEKSLVRVKLDTGRTHQIRVQFASRGFPLYGDGKYGGKSGMPLALWCHSLSVPDTDNSVLTFTEDPPECESIWLFN